jgi:hypothetical protein
MSWLREASPLSMPSNGEAMTDDEAERRYNIIAEARANRDRLADFKVTPRIHRTDGLLTEHSVNMPKQEVLPPQRSLAVAAPDAAPPPPTLTDAETLRWKNWIDDRIVAGIVAHHEGKHMRPVTRAVLRGLVVELRAEIAKAPNRPAEEFFHLDDAGNKQDADLHNPILRAVDYPIDEKIMAPIRERNRAKWLAEQNAKKTRSARIIDLPALPLRGRRA